MLGNRGAERAAADDDDVERPSAAAFPGVDFGDVVAEVASLHVLRRSPARAAGRGLPRRRRRRLREHPRSRPPSPAARHRRVRPAREAAVRAARSDPFAATPRPLPGRADRPVPAARCGRAIDRSCTRAASGRRPRARATASFAAIHLEHVVAVHHVARNGVALRAHRDLDRGQVSRRRVIRRRPVILADEDHRQFPDRREVERLVEGALVGGAVAEEAGGDVVLAGDHAPPAPSRSRSADRRRRCRWRRGCRARNRRYASSRPCPCSSRCACRTAPPSCGRGRRPWRSGGRGRDGSR